MYNRYNLSLLFILSITTTLCSMDSTMMIPIHQEEEMKESDRVVAQKVRGLIDAVLPLDFSITKQDRHLGDQNVSRKNESSIRTVLNKANINPAWPIKKLASKDIAEPYYNSCNTLFINEKVYEGLPQDEQRNMIGRCAYHIKNRTTLKEHAKNYAVVAGSTGLASYLLRRSMVKYNPQMTKDSRIFSTDLHLLSQMQARFKNRNSLRKAAFFGLGIVYLANRAGLVNAFNKWYNPYTYPSQQASVAAKHFSDELNIDEITEEKTT